MNKLYYPGEIAQYISAIHRAFQRDTTIEYKPMGLNPTSAFILVFLGRNGEVNQSVLSGKLIVNKGQITREINNLLEKGYITKNRSKINHTENLIEITEKGLKARDQVIKIRNKWWNNRIKNNDLTKEQVKSLELGLSLIHHEISNQSNNYLEEKYKDMK